MHDSRTVELPSKWADVDVRGLLAGSALAVGAGTPTDAGVSWLLPTQVERPIVMGGGIPDPATLPVQELQEALTRALESSPEETLRYGGVLGYEGLREALAERYSRLDGVKLTLDNFIIGNGSAGAIGNVCDAFLEPGDVVIVESPTFSGSIRTIRGHMAEVVSVAMDQDGVRLDLVAREIEKAGTAGKRVKFLYTVADFHNPTGTTMSLDRRKGLLELCAEHGVLLVEDAAYAEIYYEDEPPPSLYGLAAGQGILKVGTFSKPIATGLRVGWVQAREDFVAALSQVKFDMGSSPILLRALSDFVGSGKLDSHLEMMRPIYAAKCDALCQGLEDHCADMVSFVKPKGGFFLWLDCIGASATDVTRSAAELGLTFAPGALFYLNGKEDDTSHVRLALSTSDAELLREVGPRLRAAFERLPAAG